MKKINDLLNFSVINIDKPAGPTSFYVSNYIAKSLHLSKTSHMGTLDPMVSGVLPVTLGRACRLSSYLMHKEKTYIGIMRLHSSVSLDLLKEKIKQFIGKIKQTPPLRSSVKRQEREREVKTFRIIEIKNKDVLFETEVEAGTYIRKLCHDLGEKIGGAHMLELRRTNAGIFNESDSLNLYDFDTAVKSLKEGDESLIRKYCIPAENIIKKIIAPCQISEKNIKNILTGKPLTKEDLLSDNPTDLISAFLGERFIGIYKKEKDLFMPEFVFN